MCKEKKDPKLLKGQNTPPPELNPDKWDEIFTEKLKEIKPAIFVTVRGNNNIVAANFGGDSNLKILSKLSEQADLLEQLAEEKDKRIALLTEKYELLKALKGKNPSPCSLSLS